MTRILAACMVLALAACAPKEDANGDGIVDGVREPDSVSQVAPSTPVGTVSGTVVTSLNTPIDGVQVTLTLGSGAEGGAAFTSNTNAQGVYSFKNVPGASDAQLTFSKTGFSTARVSVSVPGSSGNFPINNANANAGSVTLTQLTGTVKFRVYNSAGAPARGAKATLEVTNTAFTTTNGVYGSAVGGFTTSGDVDESGVVTFTGVPEVAELARINSTGSTATSNYIVAISATDSDNDGFAEWRGSITSYSANNLFIDPNRTIYLASASTNQPLSIVATNIASLTTNGSLPYRNAVKGSDPVTIVFNQAISQADTSRLVKVVQENCETNVAVSVTQRTPHSLSIAPSSPWQLGARYNIIVRVTGIESGTTDEFIGYIFAIDSAAPRQVGTTASFNVRKAAGNMMNNAYQPGDRLFVQFDTPITNLGSAVAVAQFNLDLNNDSTVGVTSMNPLTGVGEYNGPVNSGFQVSNAEQLSATNPINGTFSCKQSDYSSLWEITGVTFPTSLNIPMSTQTKVVFPKNQNSAATYQTAWGTPVQTDVAGTIAIVP